MLGFSLASVGTQFRNGTLLLGPVPQSSQLPRWNLNDAIAFTQQKPNPNVLSKEGHLSVSLTTAQNVGFMQGWNQELVSSGLFVTNLLALQAPLTPTHDPVTTSVVTSIGNRKFSFAANFFIFTLTEVIRPKSCLSTQAHQCTGRSQKLARVGQGISESSPSPWSLCQPPLATCLGVSPLELG